MKYSYNTFDFSNNNNEYFSEKIEDLRFKNGMHTIGIYDHQLKLASRMDELIHNLAQTHTNVQIINTNAQIQDDVYALVLITFKTDGPR